MWSYLHAQNFKENMAPTVPSHMCVARHMQKCGLLQLIPSTRTAAPAIPEGVSCRCEGAFTEDHLRRNSFYSQQQRGTTDHSRKTIALERRRRLIPQETRIYVLSHLYTNGSFSTRSKLLQMQKFSLASGQCSKGHEEQKTTVICSGGIDSGVHGSGRMISTSVAGTIVSRCRNAGNGAAQYCICGWRSAVCSTTGVNNWWTARGFSSAAKQAATFNQKTEHTPQENTASLEHKSEQREDGGGRLTAISCTLCAAQGRRDHAAQKQGNRTVAGKGSEYVSNSGHPTEHTRNTENISKYSFSNSSTSTTSAMAVPIIRVNRPGSARKPGISQSCSGGLMTGSSSCSKGNEQASSSEQHENCNRERQDEEKLTTKGKEVKSSTDGTASTTRTCKNIDGKEEEFGFKYEGPEPTMHGDWSHKGRVTDF